MSTIQTLQTRRRQDGKSGFTLLELIVVLLVLGILAAIAVPTFAKVKENAVTRVVQSTLETLDRDGEAIAVSDFALSDSQIAAAVVAEMTPRAGMTITRDGAEIVVEYDNASAVAEGSVTFANGVGTIVDAVVAGGGGGGGAPSSAVIFAAANVGYDPDNSLTYPDFQSMPVPTFLSDYRGGSIDQSINEIVITVVDGSEMLDALWKPGFTGVGVGNGNGYEESTVTTRTNPSNSDHTDIVFTYVQAAYNMLLVPDLPSGSYSILRFAVPFGSGDTVTGYYIVELTPSSGAALFTL